MKEFFKDQNCYAEKYYTLLGWGSPTLIIVKCQLFVFLFRNERLIANLSLLLHISHTLQIIISKVFFKKWSTFTNLQLFSHINMHWILICTLIFFFFNLMRRQTFQVYTWTIPYHSCSTLSPSYHSLKEIHKILN